MRIALALMIAACVPLAACSAQSVSETSTSADAQVRVHPVSGLEIVDLTVVSGETRHVFAVEMARTAAEQQKGLMFRTELGPNEGMVFPRPVPDVASFWMKNTPLPLDIIFIDPDGTILNIAANTVPYSLDPVPADGPTGAVLEIPGGRAAQLGIGPGDKVDW